MVLVSFNWDSDTYTNAYQSFAIFFTTSLTSRPAYELIIIVYVVTLTKWVRKKALINIVVVIVDKLQAYWQQQNMAIKHQDTLLLCNIYTKELYS